MAFVGVLPVSPRQARWAVSLGGTAIRVVAVTVADCETNQAAWNAAIAIAGGGEVWDEAGLRWSWQAHDGQLMLNFPRAIDGAAAHRGVAAARERGARIVGAWLASDVDPSGLETAGFERGWEPWWMAAALESVVGPDDDRVSITSVVPEYGANGKRLLALADAPDARAWHAGRSDRRPLCRPRLGFAPGQITGIYDMDVWPRFRRQGLGRALLRRLCASAHAAGAQAAVLNATPDGERLYSAMDVAA
jgi:ribosomal protein S18 acetylase RimI-like enzyme